MGVVEGVAEGVVKGHSDVFALLEGQTSIRLTRIAIQKGGGVVMATA